MEYQVLSPGKDIVRRQTEEGAHICQIKISNPVLWKGRKGAALYSLHAELKADGQTVDCVDLQIGFRSIFIDGKKGFFLNGEHEKLHGVAKHQDYDQVFGSTRQEHWDQDMRDILEIGANSVRLSHYQHPQEMYQLCDENGIIVWAEIPMLKMEEDRRVFDNACSQLTELILQNIHHPCICFWGIQNEIAILGESPQMYEQVKGLADLAERLDRSRICSCANLFSVKNDSALNKLTQAVGYNIYFGWYYGEMKDSEDFVEQLHKENPNVPLGITEYGVDCNLDFHSEEPKVKDYSEEYQALYHEKVYPIFRDKEYIWGTYVWNLYNFSSEIRDEGGILHQNGKGLITYDRKIKKDAYYYYKAQWFLEPFVKIAQSRFVKRAKEEICVTVYSNQREVTLFVNGEYFQARSEEGIYHFEGISLKMGENVVLAVSDQWRDEVVFKRVEEEKLFPKGRFSVRDSCKDILEHEQVMAIIEDFSPVLARQMRERKMSLPLERVLNHMKKDVTDEQCRELNRRLTEIAK